MPKDSALSLSAQTLRDSLELATVVPAEINRMVFPKVRARFGFILPGIFGLFLGLI